MGNALFGCETCREHCPDICPTDSRVPTAIVNKDTKINSEKKSVKVVDKPIFMENVPEQSQTETPLQHPIHIPVVVLDEMDDRIKRDAPGMIISLVRIHYKY